MKGRLAEAALLALISASGCERANEGALENATPSPNASILPAPLSSAESPGRAPRGALEHAELTSKVGALEGGIVVPQPMRLDQAPDDDLLPLKDMVGVSLQGEWRYADQGPPPKFPEMNQAGIDAARKLTAPRMTVRGRSCAHVPIISGTCSFGPARRVIASCRSAPYARCSGSAASTPFPSCTLSRKRAPTDRGTLVIPLENGTSPRAAAR
jgi:hypothetical protein